jgi:hypothetical protein
MEILESLKSTSPGKVSVDSRILEKDLHRKNNGDIGILKKYFPRKSQCR